MKNIDLIELPQKVIIALAAGDLASANAMTSFQMGPYLVGPDCLPTWQIRTAQILNDSISARWITRAIVDNDLAIAVGVAGFHGAPDNLGMIELGYAVDLAFRRQGYAKTALAALLKWAKDESAIQTVRASIAPDNLASRALVDQYGFTEVGEQWDDVDGREIIFEVRLARDQVGA